MAGGFGGGPRFPGEWVYHPPPRPAPRDSWLDRLRHGWLAYALLTAAIALSAVVVLLVYLEFGLRGVRIGLLLAGWVAAYGYLLVLRQRILDGRDPVTGQWPCE